MLLDELFIPVIAFLRNPLQPLLIIHTHQTIALLIAIDPAVKIHRRPDIIAHDVHALGFGLQDLFQKIVKELDPVIIFNPAVFIRNIIRPMTVFRNIDRNIAIFLLSLDQGVVDALRIDFPVPMDSAEPADRYRTRTSP